MGHMIEIESIRRLAMNPGETLVVTLPDATTKEEFAAVRDAFKRHMPDGVKYLITNTTLDLSVVATPTP